MHSSCENLTTILKGQFICEIPSPINYFYFKNKQTKTQNVGSA